MKYFGVMLDMSRNGVMKANEVKRYASIIKKMGYNMLQLYMEDVYEVEGEPYFGYMRGRYTVKELKDIVDYCNSIGIEAVPCIQTLAHLENSLRWPIYENIIDVDNILLVKEERVYTLIDRMFNSLRKSFTTNLIHIGMDEAYLLGLGKYLEKHGFTNRVSILKEHLDRVMDLARKYNFEPMMWSDMFFRLANNGEYYPKEPTLTKEVIDSVPKDLGLVYWDYFHTDKEYYKKMMKAHMLAGKNVWFAGGAWTWAGFSSGNRFALKTMIPAMTAAKECSLSNILFTLWGDYGKECSYYSVLPALFTARKIYDGETNLDNIKKEFKELLNIDYDSLMDLDIPNYVGKNKDLNTKENPSKHMFYSDPFLGFLDSTISNDVKEEYIEYAKRLRSHIKGTEFDYLFNNAANLCDTLSIKYSLGRRTRDLYQNGDKNALKSILNDYDKVLEYIDNFYESFRTMWFKECKPNGFEIFDIKIGGLKQRLTHCKRRLVEYIDGKIDSIPELEELLLDYYGNVDEYKEDAAYITPWSKIACVSII